MRTLSFLGLRDLPLDEVSPGYFHVRPLPSVGPKWPTGALWIQKGTDGIFRLTIDLITLSIDGLALSLKTSNALPLTAVGDKLRPESGVFRQDLVLSLNQRGLLLGPLSIAPAYVAVAFKEGEGAEGLLATKIDLLRAGEGGAAVQKVFDPLSLRINDVGAIVLSLATNDLVVPPENLSCRVIASSGAAGAAVGASFINDRAQVIPFKDIASGAPLELDLALEVGPVPLHMPSAGGQAAIEARNCRLGLKLVSSAGFGGQLAAATLKAAADGPLELRFRGLRNSRNKPEAWTTMNPVPLGFRVRQRGDHSKWSSPLVLPSRLNQTHFVRVNDQNEARLEKPKGARAVHSWFGNSRFVVMDQTRAALSCLEASAESPLHTEPSIASALLFDQTRPWFQFERLDFDHGRPGDAYRAGELTWRFSGNSICGGAPLLPSSLWQSGVESKELAANKALNESFGGLRLESEEAVHETGLVDRGAMASIQAVVPERLGPNKNSPRIGLSPGDLRLMRGQRLLAMAAPTRPGGVREGSVAELKFQLEIPTASSVEYAVHWPGRELSTPRPITISDIREWAQALAGPIDPLAPVAIGNVVDDPKRPTTLPLAILKLGRTKTLKQIRMDLERHVLPAERPAFDDAWTKVQNLLEAVDRAVLGADWVGLLLLDVPADFAAFPALQAMAPTSPDLAPRLNFVAVSVREPQEAQTNVAVSAGLQWINPKINAPATSRSSEQEASFVSESLSIAFRDRKLIRFHARAWLTFYSFFGVGASSDASEKTTRIAIVGSARALAGERPDPKKGYEIRFVAEARGDQRLTIFPVGNKSLPEDAPSLIKRVWIKRLEVVNAPDKDSKNSKNSQRAEIQIDGAIEFGRPKISVEAGLERFFERLRDVSFTGLRVALDKLDGLDPRLLKFHYPSLKFDVDLPHMGLLGDALKLKFNQLIIDWEGPGFDLGRFPALPVFSSDIKFDFSKPKLVFMGRIDFGALPELFARKLDGFSLEGVFAMNFEAGKLFGVPYVGMGGFGFNGLDLDLLSFLRIRAKSLQLQSKTWTREAQTVGGAALSFVGLSIDVLGVPLLKNGSGGFFSLEKSAGDGFWALLRDPIPSPLFKLNWAFAAQNIDFGPDVAKAVLTAPTSASTEDHSKLNLQLEAAWQKGELYPSNIGSAKGWTFAASIEALSGGLQGRALVQDGGFTGLALSGRTLEQLFSWKFALVGIYRKDVRPGEDYFYFSVTLPPFTFGAMHFTGGEIAAELFTSGDFTVDVGFPWPAIGGGRQWQRTVGAIVTPGQASGGFYLRKRREMLATKSGQQDQLAVAGGIAVQWGLGAAFGGGVFTVWARIGVYVILEGEIQLILDKRNPKIVGFALHGAAGILAEGHGKIDWWVISVQVGLRASAEIRASLIWEEGKDLVMPIEAELFVSASAEACIGGSCARICRGITVSLSLPVRYSLKFG